MTRPDPLESALRSAFDQGEPDGPECHLCGSASGPWVPTGDHWPSGAQKLVCQGGCTGAAPLTPERLAGIAAREAAATPGPWCTDDWEIYQGAEYFAGAMWIGETCRGTTTFDQDRADAAFTAHVRSDIPALLAEVERLKARVAELEADSEKAAEFVADRAEYITAIRGCHDSADYQRWQGHAEARTVLASRLGLPIAWPTEPGEPRG